MRLQPAQWILLLGSLACSGKSQVPATDAPTEKTPSEEAYRAEVESFHADRITRLTSETGWLTLIGLHWLDEGSQTFGSDAANDVVFGAGASVLGTLTRTDHGVHLEVSPDVVITSGGSPITAMDLDSDANGPPTRLDHDTLQFYVIERGDRVGIRVKNRDSVVRTGFRGVERYPVSQNWRLTGHWEARTSDKSIALPNVLGQVNEVPSPGTVVFKIDGEELRLDPVQYPDSDSLFFVFSDATSGVETYGGGRFLNADLPQDGQVILDFNKATNPPCAFTPYGTCPVPPPQNVLAVAIRAGEKRYGDH